MELEIRNLSKRYGKKQALSNVSCKLNDGVYGLLGGGKRCRQKYVDEYYYGKHRG